MRVSKIFSSEPFLPNMRGSVFPAGRKAIFTWRTIGTRSASCTSTVYLSRPYAANFVAGRGVAMHASGGSDGGRKSDTQFFCGRRGHIKTDCAPWTAAKLTNAEDKKPNGGGGRANGGGGRRTGEVERIVVSSKSQTLETQAQTSRSSQALQWSPVEASHLWPSPSTPWNRRTQKIARKLRIPGCSTAVVCSEPSGGSTVRRLGGRLS